MIPDQIIDYLSDCFDRLLGGGSNEINYVSDFVYLTGNSVL